jgi:arylsulfatase A-like enzyme
MTSDKRPASTRLPAETPGIDRRTLVKGLGAALAAVAGAAPLERLATPALAAALEESARKGGPLGSRPNIVLLITDQERHPQWWPDGWAAANLPNRQRLLDHGLIFERGFCSAAMCTPSRATLLTGMYPVQHGMTNTLSEGGTVSPTEPTLRQDVLNMGTMLRSAGYDVQYRGKWHLSKGPDGADSTAEQVAAYGFDGWIPPEAAQDTKPEHFGGGCANHDTPYAQQAVDFLRHQAPADPRPFFLVASFGNPHDVLAYPETWDQETPAGSGCHNYLPYFPDLFDQGIDLPPTYDENLVTNYKPTAQAQLKLVLTDIGIIGTPERARNYANFYAFLHTVVDQHIGAVLDALEADEDVHRNTIVIRISDHGELGMSHGGLRQKAFNVYEETLRVPIIVSNPVLFPEPVSTDAFATLVDLMPTVAALADVPNRSALPLRGQDLTPVILDAAAHPLNPTASVQPDVYFTFDDENASSANGLTLVTPPKNIRCVRTERYKLAMYFDPMRRAPSQYELYDLANDPSELDNLAHPANPDHDPALLAQMKALLDRKMTETDTHPLRGSVVANGRFQSAAGSCPAQPAAAGRANFNFNCRNPQSRQPDAPPDGNVRFEHAAASLGFLSSSVDAVWVSGSTAHCRGRGQVNGAGHYGFELWLRAAGTFGFTSPDYVRFQIVDATKLPGAADYVVYDNALGSGANLNGSALQSGTIEIRPLVPRSGSGGRKPG